MIRRLYSLLEFENLNDIAEVAKANNVTEDEVDSDMLNSYYESKIKSQSATDAKALKRHASQVWSEFFQATPEENKEDNNNNNTGEALPATNDVAELVKALDTDDVDLSKVEELVSRVGKLSTLPRSESFTDAFELLENMAKKVKQNEPVKDGNSFVCKCSDS